MSAKKGDVTKRPIVVQKYGGSSVATADHIKNVARRVQQRHAEGNSLVVVVSAMGKTTDSLVALAAEVSSRPERREMDMLLHSGEIMSAALLAMAITESGVPAVAFTGQQAGMKTDSMHTQARVRSVQGERILAELAAGRIVVVAGFQGVTDDLQVTTLGRGGSDTSAVAIAVGLSADHCEILTDVDGVYTADPRIVPGARKLAWCSYDEMLELAILGAKVLHSRSVEIARRFGIPLLVATSFAATPGTVVCSAEKAKELQLMEDVTLRGIAHKEDVVKISLVGVPDEPGVSGRVFSRIGEWDVNISLIVQSEHRGGENDISFVVSADDMARLEPQLDDLVKLVGAREARVDDKVATVSVVGEGVHREVGIAARMFSALGERKINIDLISTSNLKLTCVIPQERVKDAVESIHAEFFEE